MSKQRHHFTLVEILAAIGILLLLVGITIGGLRHAAARGDEAKTTALIQEFCTALEAFHDDYGRFPLQATAGNVDFSNTQWNLFLNKTSNKRGKSYLSLESISNSAVLKDAYDNPLQYQYPSPDETKSTKFLLWSKGADGTDATEDDICSWK